MNRDKNHLKSLLGTIQPAFKHIRFRRNTQQSSCCYCFTLKTQLYLVKILWKEFYFILHGILRIFFYFSGPFYHLPYLINITAHTYCPLSTTMWAVVWCFVSSRHDHQNIKVGNEWQWLFCGTFLCTMPFCWHKTNKVAKTFSLWELKPTHV